MERRRQQELQAHDLRMAQLYVEAHEPSLYLRREKLSLQYACRLRANPENPCYDVTFHPNHRETFARRQSSIPTFGLRVLPLFEQIGLPLGNIARCVLPSIPPWTMHRPIINFSLTGLKKGTTPSYVYLYKFLEVSDSYHGYHHIYTDGSRQNDEVAAAAISTLTSLSSRLPDKSSIFSAESKALLLALDIVENSTYGRYIILSDSLSCLMALDNMKYSHPTICDILVKLHLLTKSNHVIFGWLPSHVGISGNEKADFAAKSALSLPVEPQVISYKDFYMYIFKHILSIWQSKWDGEINNKLHAIKPKLGEWALACRKSRKEESILCRLRVGHSYLTHSFLLRNEAQPVCGRCQQSLTVRHVLVDCAALTSVRSRFYPPLPWEEFFKEVDLYKLFKFLKYLNVYNRILQFLVDNGADEECLTGISDIFNHRSQVEDTHNAVDSEYKLNKSHDGALRDYGDGDFYKDNPLFNTECKALQILLYLYEFTASNPIGHNVKNFKLGGFYMLLGNVPPKYRSQQYVIQLFILCMSSIIKQIGFEVELLMHDLKTLKTEGLLITRSGDNLFYGTVSVVLTDNLGAHSIGGFLESFHCLRNCRFCFTPRETMQTIMNCSDLPMRSVKIHTAQLGNVQQAQSLSSSYSVKTDNCLNKPRYYHVINGLPSHLAPDLFEEVVSETLTNVIVHLVSEDTQQFSVANILLLEDVLQYACASELDRGHVMVMKDIIEYVHESFRQIFPEETKKPKMPFMLHYPQQMKSQFDTTGDAIIPVCLLRDEYQRILEKDMGGDCLEVFTSTSVNTIVGTLAMNEWSALIDRAYKAKSSIIEYVHESFRQIFPEETIKPKIHFMLHYPQQMKSFGANLEQMKRFC
ncbi:hypothetical protein GQR58_001470 [Nymphon striatum]|nr:hypothetical protein GQR58_001470 [Nymphon striatum]